MNPDKVREIRKLIGDGAADWKLYTEVAKSFNVTPSTIYHIHVRRTWKWVA